MHLGHVVNALYVWGLAAAYGAEVLLRLEDHDRIRCRPEYETAWLEDLDWLGFVADSGRHPVSRQSDRQAVYAAALAGLRRTHHVYACACSRKDIGGDRYDGRCRMRGLTEADGMGIRVAMADDAASGDLLLRDRDGNWTYQFAVTVDDFDQGITHVIRGEDLADSTARQVALARMLGRAEPPEFIHHPLIYGRDGAKLSKSAGDTGIRHLRLTGVTPSEVIGRAAAAIGLIESPRPIEPDRVGELFP
jgi:glutamyl/glutaminyl-tRNA synthetase